MDRDKSPAPKGKHDISSRRAFLLALYIFLLIVLVKLYWPGWPYPDTSKPTTPVAPVSGPNQVPQN